jgi:hypothetical protein
VQRLVEPNLEELGPGHAAQQPHVRRRLPVCASRERELAGRSQIVVVRIGRALHRPAAEHQAAGVADIAAVDSLERQRPTHRGDEIGAEQRIGELEEGAQRIERIDDVEAQAHGERRRGT